MAEQEPPLAEAERRQIVRDGLAVAVATGAYGISFGAIGVSTPAQATPDPSPPPAPWAMPTEIPSATTPGITAGTKVTGPDGTVVKARELSGKSNILFRRNSTTGAVEVTPWKGDGIELNAALHAN